MEVIISDTKESLGKEAAVKGAGLIRKAIAEKGEANIILATGTSQFEMLNALVKEDINWSGVTGFHLDEYIGLSWKHPASFRRYLKERFVDIVSPNKFYYINGEADATGECSRLGDLISKRPVDVAFVGIGENGHLAFNDPPADFETEEAYLIVKLDKVCRRQQLGEGWFTALDEVPEKAISMSIKQIMKSKAIICSVPDLRKAKAVKKVVSGTVTSDVPASVLQRHNTAWIFLDRDSASLLE